MPSANKFTCKTDRFKFAELISLLYNIDTWRKMPEWYLKMDKIKKQVPKFVWIVLIILGCVDLIRGFMHTVVLEYAALNIAGRFWCKKY